MKVILDTDKKTITVPWNYAAKLAEINRIAQEYGGKDVEPQTFTGFIDRIWRECIRDADAHVLTAGKPVRTAKKHERGRSDA